MLRSEAEAPRPSDEDELLDADGVARAFVDATDHLLLWMNGMLTDGPRVVGRVHDYEDARAQLRELERGEADAAACRRRLASKL